MNATADWYARAAVELAATSERQVSWARGVAADPELLELIDGLPREHRQPSLLFAVAAWCGAPAVEYASWRDFVLGNWGTVGREMARRRTQTNEVGRCIPLLVGLAAVDGPIALLELGASAGLCLALDRYSYRFDDGLRDGPVLGSGSPLLTCSTGRTLVMKDRPSQPERSAGETAAPPRTHAAPTRMPDIVWRAGIDLAPLDVRDAHDLRWLEALLPPDRPARLERLRAAIATVRRDPPRLVAGDALGTLAELAAEARAAAPHATLVVASLGTAVYLPPADRAALPHAVAALGAHLIAFESAAALPGIAERLRQLRQPRHPDISEPNPFVLSVDGEPLATGSAHGDSLSWLSESSPARQPELPDSAT